MGSLSAERARGGRRHVAVRGKSAPRLVKTVRKHQIAVWTRCGAARLRARKCQHLPPDAHACAPRPALARQACAHLPHGIHYCALRRRVGGHAGGRPHCPWYGQWACGSCLTLPPLPPLPPPQESVPDPLSHRPGAATTGESARPHAAWVWEAGRSRPQGCLALALWLTAEAGRPRCPPHHPPRHRRRPGRSHQRLGGVAAVSALPPGLGGLVSGGGGGPAGGLGARSRRPCTHAAGGNLCGTRRSHPRPPGPAARCCRRVCRHPAGAWRWWPCCSRSTPSWWARSSAGAPPSSTPLPRVGAALRLPRQPRPCPGPPTALARPPRAPLATCLRLLLSLPQPSLRLPHPADE